jgi:hypothetical protein
MKLFENHDIVVLCERIHPEYTQWELFSRIILNDTFADKIGNIGTEFGRANEQARLDSLMNIHFENEEERKQSFASLVRENGGLWPLWANTNIFDFAVNLSKFNENKNQNKVNWFFLSDTAEWKNVHNTTDWEKVFYKNTEAEHDMAYRVINLQNRLLHAGDKHKMLLILNTAHAYNNGSDMAAYYLHAYYQSNIAFVWLNNFGYAGKKMQLFRQGWLDAAAQQVNNNSWALPFDNTIIGEEHFALLPNSDHNHLKMKEVFDGMIYHAYPRQQYCKIGYPYILANYKDTLFKRCALLGENYLKTIKDNIYMIENGKIQIQRFSIYAVENIKYYASYFFIAFCLLGCLILFLKTATTKNDGSN